MHCDNTHAGDTIWTQPAIFKNIHIYATNYMLAIVNNFLLMKREGMNLKGSR